MKKFILLTVMMAVSAVFASERQYIWPKDKMPDRQPHQIAAMTDETSKPDFVATERTEPYVEWYDAPEGGFKTDSCVILISGGGYGCQCDVAYVKQWKERLMAEGVRPVNLVHRTPRPKALAYYQSAWEDGQRAVRFIRAQAEKRGFNPERIGVMSMSAGSHLATLLATSALTAAYEPVDDLDRNIPCHINWATTFAIAYGMTDGLGGPNRRDGDAVDVTLDPLFKFDAKTAPMCMMHGGQDVYSPASSTFIYRQLRRMKIPAEVHLYPDKPHGMFGLDRAIEFMRQMGFLGALEPEVDLMSRFSSDVEGVVYNKRDLWTKGTMPDVQTNQCQPYLEWYIPSNLTTKAVQVIWSGGAYWGNGPESFEVTPVRRFLNEKGMAVVTVKYRTPRPAAPLKKHTTAWQDVQRAVRIVRSEAKARGLDPNRIGVMGSSAGGHLALMAATSSKRHAYWPYEKIDNLPCNVQWAVCIYPAYALTDGEDQHNVHGGNENEDRLVPEFSFDLDTPPMLFIHGDADGWAAMNSVKAWEQLRRMGIQGELHTLALRNHCFQHYAAPGTGSYTWLDRVWEFLSAKGFNK